MIPQTTTTTTTTIQGLNLRLTKCLTKAECHILRVCADQLHNAYMLICKPKPTGLKAYIDV